MGRRVKLKTVINEMQKAENRRLRYGKTAAPKQEEQALSFAKFEMIVGLIALPIFAFSITFPQELESMITIVGRMSTPISMFIMGMRLATTELKTVFCSPRCYAASVMKLFVMPLLAFVFALVLPIATEVKQTFFIVTGCPSASIVLNFSELVGKGQKEAAGMVLLTTILSVISLPIMMLLLPLL